MISSPTLARFMFETGAVELNIKEPFTWASGLKSPIYCDCRILLSNHAERLFFITSFHNIISHKFNSASVIAGVATAGIAWAGFLAPLLNWPMLYVRSQPKNHGKGKQIEGEVNLDSRIVVVEDVISTGMSSLNAVNVLRENGYRVEGVVCIFDYRFSETDDKFKEANVAKASLVNLTDLINYANERGIIVDEIALEILHWRGNPKMWKPKT